MKRVIATLLVLYTTATAAALPPGRQTLRDLDAMIAFIQSHYSVISTLKTINLHDYSVGYGDGCLAEFERAPSSAPPDWVGPMEPLVFKRSNCPVE